MKYPYTNQPGRLESLYGVLDAITVCPVAFEIYERLKEFSSAFIFRNVRNSKFSSSFSFAIRATFLGGIMFPP